MIRLRIPDKDGNLPPPTWTDEAAQHSSELPPASRSFASNFPSAASHHHDAGKFAHVTQDGRQPKARSKPPRVSSPFQAHRPAPAQQRQNQELRINAGVSHNHESPARDTLQPTSQPAPSASTFGGTTDFLDLANASPEEVEAALDALLTTRFERERSRMQKIVRGSGRKSRLSPWDSARDSAHA